MVGRLAQQGQPPHHAQGPATVRRPESTCVKTSMRRTSRSLIRTHPVDAHLPGHRPRRVLGTFLSSTSRTFLSGAISLCWCSLELTDTSLVRSDSIGFSLCRRSRAVRNVGTAVLWRFPRPVGRVGRLHRSILPIRPAFPPLWAARTFQNAAVVSDSRSFRCWF